MTEINNSEISGLLKAHRDDVDSDSNVRILTQEEVKEKIKSYIAPLTKQLEDLTWLIQGMLSVHQANPFPMVSAIAYTSTVYTSYDIRKLYILFETN